MHYLRKSKPSADTPAQIPASPAELVQNLTSQRDSKVLAATSSAIALSISSAFTTTHGTSGDGPTVQGKDEIRQTAYAAIRMAVEITKESSDLCLPLKAVVGAVRLDEELRCEYPDQKLSTSSPFPRFLL
jgi:hypothetical protein